VINDPGANRDEAGFTGHIRDRATGLTYAQARYYNPVTARFLAPDPVGFADGGWPHFNRYVYVENDPVNLIDPDGDDAVAVTADVDVFAVIPTPIGYLPIGAGASAGGVVGFETHIPSPDRIATAIGRNPGDVVGAIVDAIVEVQEVGVIGSSRFGAGLDVSAGGALEYTPGSVSDLRGTSTQVELGAGPVSVTGSAIDGQAHPLPNDPAGATVGVELGASALPASTTISRKVTVAATIRAKPEE
jgi:RHS repeat-associated protein